MSLRALWFACALSIAACAVAFTACQSPPPKSDQPPTGAAASCTGGGGPCAGIAPPGKDACCPGFYCNQSISPAGVCCAPATPTNPCPTSLPDGGK